MKTYEYTAATRRLLAKAAEDLAIRIDYLEYDGQLVPKSNRLALRAIKKALDWPGKYERGK